MDVAALRATACRGQDVSKPSSLPSPQHRGVDLRAVDVDDSEGGVDGELAEHGQCDGDPGEIEAGRRLVRYEGTRDAHEAAEHVEEAQWQPSADTAGENGRIIELDFTRFLQDFTITNTILQRYNISVFPYTTRLYNIVQ